jgi:hypothetical protein
MAVFLVFFMPVVTVMIRPCPSLPFKRKKQAKIYFELL